MRSKISAMSGSNQTGLIVVDAGVVIGHLDRANPHHHAATDALREAASSAQRLVLPVMAFAECLVHPSRVGSETAARFEAALASIPIGVLDADADIARSAALLRAEHPSLKLPDAFVVATAAVHEADALITTDRRWPPSLTSTLPFTLHII